MKMTQPTANAISLDNLSAEDKASLIRELEISRQIRTRNTYIPTLPKFSGEENSQDDFKHWNYTLKSLIEEGVYTDETLKIAVRKSLTGEAAKHLRNQGSATVSDIQASLELHYDDVKDDTVTWEDFYNARQRKKENVSSWKIRLEDILNEVMPTTDKANSANREKKLKTQWWTKLHSTTLKASSRHKYDDPKVDLKTLFLYVKALEREQDLDAPRATLHAVSEESCDAAAADKFEEYMKKTDARLDKIMKALVYGAHTRMHNRTQTNERHQMLQLWKERPFITRLSRQRKRYEMF